MSQWVMIRRCASILLFGSIVAWLLIGLLLGQTKKESIYKQRFEINPFDILLETECLNGLRGIYTVHFIRNINNSDDNILAKVKLVIPNGSRPRWSPQHNYILYEKHGWIGVMDRRGKTIEGWVGGYPVYGWGPDENAILIGAKKYHQEAFTFEGLGFKTLWKEPWDSWEKWKEMFISPTIGIPTQYGITFPHPKLPDALWLGSPTMSPDWKMHAFEGYRPVSNYGRNYSKIYVVKWVEPPQYSKDHSWLPAWRLTTLPDDLLEVNPQFSPDGKWIAFEVIDPKAPTHRVYLATPDGKVIRPIPLPFSKNGEFDSKIPMFKKQYYEKVRYKIVKWIDKEKLIIRLEPTTFIGRTEGNDNIEFWLVDIKKNDDSKLIIVESNVGLAVIDWTGKFAVGYKAPTGYYLSASLEIVDLNTKKEYFVKGFPKDMIVY